jgi:hypothetical protein
MLRYNPLLDKYVIIRIAQSLDHNTLRTFLMCPPCRLHADPDIRRAFLSQIELSRRETLRLVNIDENGVVTCKEKTKLLDPLGGVYDHLLQRGHNILCMFAHASLWDTKASNVDALAGVRSIDLWRTKVSNVDALAGVHTIDLSFTRVSNVDALAGVHSIALANTPVSNVDALAGVHRIDLRHTCVRNVDALAGVHTIDLSNTPVSNVDALAGVHTIDVTNTNVRNMDALVGARIKQYEHQAFFKIF